VNEGNSRHVVLHGTSRNFPASSLQRLGTSDHTLTLAFQPPIMHDFRSFPGFFQKKKTPVSVISYTVTTRCFIIHTNFLIIRTIPIFGKCIFVRSGGSTAVTMKNFALWDKKSSSYLTGDTLNLRYKALACYWYVRFGISMAMTKKNAVFWDVTSCGSRNNRRFEGKYRLHHQGKKNRRARNNVSSNLQLKHAANKYYTILSSACFGC
jgi:hypothetical protein